ncbi:MAG: copper chaperone PCu(A)C [Gemmatimonadaceae bacterium]|nr:copper chaperone PCu(A)C [Gemmatimonadaceae bacterium]
MRDAWARPADSAATTAAYLVIVNRDTAAIALSAVTSPVSASVSLHESMVMSGMVHMSPLMAPQAIPPGDSLVLKPGAKHLMISSLRRPLAVADSVLLELILTDGRVLHVTAFVRTP